RVSLQPGLFHKTIRASGRNERASLAASPYGRRLQPPHAAAGAPGWPGSSRLLPASPQLSRQPGNRPEAQGISSFLPTAPRAPTGHLQWRFLLARTYARWHVQRPVKGMHGRVDSPLVDVTLHTSIDVRLGQQPRITTEFPRTYRERICPAAIFLP